MAVSAIAQASISKVDLPQSEIDTIIRKFTRGESLFRQALNFYMFNRNATIQTVGMGGQITGTFKKDSFITFDQEGNRFEKLIFAPVSTLTEVTITAADLENMGGIDPCAIEPKNIPTYNFTYLGKEKIDDLDLHVFEVTPKAMPDPKSGVRLFSGRVWVDVDDLMIVKSKGKAVPETKKNKFPVVETWRENIDGKYWFPSYAYANDELVFDSGQVVRLRMRVKYANYKLGRTDVIVGDAEDLSDTRLEPTPTPKPTKPE
jgi:hypothetical protein